MEIGKEHRSIAIVAHVDHGKTTLVDALFKQSGIYKSHEAVVDRAMDRLDQERERGMTIMAKNAVIEYPDRWLQLVDTPGHADFGGEVERSLMMVDGIVLLVDAAEGPLPQTRFVLRKALELGLSVVVAINKIDRSDARPAEVLDDVYSLFIDVGANEEQLDFPVLYTNGRAGTATTDLSIEGADLSPLVNALFEGIPALEDKTAEPFCLQVNHLDYDPYVGRLAMGRVLAGQISLHDRIHWAGRDSSQERKVSGLFGYVGMQRSPVKEAHCGMIVALAIGDNVAIGDTLSSTTAPQTLPPIAIDVPTVSMVMQPNNGDLAGKSGGKFLTSRHLRERLEREAFANVSISIESGDSAEQFVVMARGELQLAILLETLRRELYEICVRPPQVRTRMVDGQLEEPVERIIIDIPPEHIGSTSELVGGRRGQMIDQKVEGSRVRLEYRLPTRGLLGLRGALLTATRGTAIVHTVFDGWQPWGGDLPKRRSGALVADRFGTTTTYALFHLQPRGRLFIGAGAIVYEGMVIGEHNRDNDLRVNAVREKKLTNVRSSGKDDALALEPAAQMTLEKSLEWIKDDEMVEVTPNFIRLRKASLKK